MLETTQQTIERVGLIPVLRARNAAQAHAVVEAMIRGGVTIVEVTMTVPGAIDLLKALKTEYGATILLGSGTVTTPEEAEDTIDAGADVCRQPKFPSRGDRQDENSGKALDSRRAYPYRGHHRMARRRRLCKDLPVFGDGWRQLSQVSARALSFP